jgi:hypothetical protein
MANRTYKKLFNQRPVITSFGNYKFPKGIYISVDFMIALVICFTPALALSPVISAVTTIHRWLVTLGLTILGAWASTKFDPKGKPFPVFVLNAISYFFRNHSSNGWRGIRLDKTEVGTLEGSVRWIESNGTKIHVGMLPAEILLTKDDVIEVESGTVLDAYHKGHQTIISRHRFGGVKTTKRMTLGIQPGIITVSRKGVKWRAKRAVPQFGTMPTEEVSLKHPSSSIKF